MTMVGLLKFSRGGILVVLCLSAILSSCTKRNFYVKYEVESSTIYHGGTLIVSVTDEAESVVEYLIGRNEVWDVTVGPVRPGFTANMTVVAVGPQHDKLKLYPRIYVNRDNQPFTLELDAGSETPRDSLSISYTL